jgi:hypothetical protein
MEVRLGSLINPMESQMIKSYGLPAIAVVLLTYAAPSAMAQSSGTTQAKAPEVQFVQVAKNVAFKDGVLTLGDASPMTTFFSDRPERLTGQLRNDLFAKLWNEGKNGFKNDPPNAALTVFNPEGKPMQAIMVLTNPRLDGTNILFDARTLKGDIPAQGGESALFIDGYQTPCNSGLNDAWLSEYPCWAATAFSGQ